MDAGQVRGREVRFEETMDRFGGRFARRGLRRQAGGCVRGSPGPVGRKNGRQPAEPPGREKPYGIRRLRGHAGRRADDVRGRLVRHAADHLVSEDDPAVLIVDETGFPKKGHESVGVHRQYSGTAGRVENSRVGVFLAPGTSRGRALTGRALCLPEAWCGDKARLAGAGVPADVRRQAAAGHGGAGSRVRSGPASFVRAGRPGVRVGP